MRCSNCGRDSETTDGRCAYCGADAEGEVRVMSSEEKNSYRGVTIDTVDTSEARYEDRYEQTRARRQTGGPRVYAKRISFGSSSGNWLYKFLFFAGLAAVAAFLLFVALPVLFVGVGVAIAVWMVLNFLKR